MQLSTRTHHVRSSAGSRSLRCTPIIRAPHPRCHLRCQAALQPGTSLKNNPAFHEQLDSTVGGQASLSQFISGKKALVAFFYPRAGTSDCTVEAAQFREHSEEISSLGGAIVGISGDSLKDLDVFRLAQRLDYPLLSDKNGTMRKAFGIEQKARVTFVVKDGNVVLAYEDQSSPKQHVAKAIEALKGSGGSGGAGGGSQPYQPGELSDKQNEAFTAAEQL